MLKTVFEIIGMGTVVYWLFEIAVMLVNKAKVVYGNSSDNATVNINGKKHVAKKRTDKDGKDNYEVKTEISIPTPTPKKTNSETKKVKKPTTKKPTEQKMAEKKENNKTVTNKNKKAKTK